jgi:hypothetical protein
LQQIFLLSREVCGELGRNDVQKSLLVDKNGMNSIRKNDDGRKKATFRRHKETPATGLQDLQAE